MVLVAPVQQLEVVRLRVESLLRWEGQNVRDPTCRHNTRRPTRGGGVLRLYRPEGQDLISQILKRPTSRQQWFSVKTAWICLIKPTGAWLHQETSSFWFSLTTWRETCLDVGRHTSWPISGPFCEPKGHISRAATLTPVGDSNFSQYYEKRYKLSVAVSWPHLLWFLYMACKPVLQVSHIILVSSSAHIMI